MAKREWSAKLAKGVETLVLINSPFHAIEHLIHAWDALRAIGMDPSGDNFIRNRAYAHARLDGARKALAAGSKVKHAALFSRELNELDAAINATCP